MIRITDDTMTGYQGATATRVADIDGNQQWVLSWLDDQTVSRNEAISGLMIAEYVLAAAAADRPLDAKAQAHVTGWAEELNLTFATAVRLVMAPPRPVADVAELRRVFGEPVEGRDWHAMRPRDFGLNEKYTQTAMLLHTDPAGMLF
jgi:hypothetical protein